MTNLFNTPIAGINSLVTKTELASADGAGLVGFIAPGAGATARTVQAKLRETVSVRDFGAVGNSATNDRAAFQAATDYCASLPFGGTVYVPPGTYRIIGAVTQSRLVNPDAGAVNYVGAGIGATVIIHTGSTTLFQVNGNETIVAKQYKGLRVSGMTLLGLSREANQTAIGHTLVSGSHYEDLQIEGFDYAFYLQDVDQADFTSIIAQFNNHGLFARQDPRGPAVVPNCTQPNQYTFTGAKWMNNNQYGLFGDGGSNWTFVGGVISTNGQSNPSGGTGITIQNPGYQGGAILSMNGTNFESNVGLADVRLIATAASANLDSSYLFSNCSFNRAHATMGGNPLATNVILTNFGAIGDVGVQHVTLDTCVFKTLGNYVPSGSRPYLNWSGVQGRTAKNFSAPGTVFQASVEAPSFVQNISKPFIQVSRAANQTIDNVTPTVWQIDTVDRGFSWAGTINGSNQISVPEAGYYAVSAHMIFTTTPANDPRLEILLNGSAAIASNAVTGLDTISAGSLIWLQAGSLISLRITHNNGASVTAAGSSVAPSYLSIMKLVDA